VLDDCRFLLLITAVVALAVISVAQDARERAIFLERLRKKDRAMRGQSYK